MTDQLIDEISRCRDSDPVRALKLLEKLSDSPREMIIRAITLIDCGDAIHCYESVREGVEILGQYEIARAGTFEQAFNLANGLQIMSRLVYGPSCAFLGETPLNRFRARVLFGKSISSERDPDKLKTQASTNIGILLQEEGRWIEALDCFQSAVQLYSQNGVAAFQEMRSLMKFVSLVWSRHDTYKSYTHVDATVSRVHDLAYLVEGNYSTIREFSGPSALPVVQKAVQNAKAASTVPNYPPQDPYFQFVKNNNLSLSVCSSSEEYANGRFDLLSIPTLSQDKNDPHLVPEVFGMMNIVKSDFALARQMFFESSNCEWDSVFRETTSHSDTLDYGLYGVRYSALTTAQRIAYDIFDKIAVLASTYLNVPRAHQTDFLKMWWKFKKNKNDKQEFKPEIERELRFGNSGLMALLSLSNDLTKNKTLGNGYLEKHRSFRRSSTHRFTVLHDEGGSDLLSNSKAIEHENIMKFEGLCLNTIKLARAAIFYLVDTIICIEDRKNNESGALRITSEVPDHDRVRGRKK